MRQVSAEFQENKWQNSTDVDIKVGVMQKILRGNPSKLVLRIGIDMVCDKPTYKTRASLWNSTKELVFWYM